MILSSQDYLLWYLWRFISYMNRIPESFQNTPDKNMLLKIQACAKCLESLGRYTHRNHERNVSTFFKTCVHPAPHIVRSTVLVLWLTLFGGQSLIRYYTKLDERTFRSQVPHLGDPWTPASMDMLTRQSTTHASLLLNTLLCMTFFTLACIIIRSLVDDVARLFVKRFNGKCLIKVLISFHNDRPFV